MALASRGFAINQPEGSLRPHPPGGQLRRTAEASGKRLPLFFPRDEEMNLSRSTDQWPGHCESDRRRLGTVVHRHDETCLSQDDPLASHPQGESLDVFEFLARVLTQIPKPRQHGGHYMSAYSSRARSFRKRKNLPLQSLPSQQDPKAKPEPKLSPKKRAALRKRWAQLIKRVHQTDPLHCDCGGTS